MSTNAAPVVGVSSTRQGARVLDFLGSSPAFRSAQQLHQELRSSGHPVGLTTVYRHLQLLDDAGEVDVLRLGSGETLYRRCAGGHHHHLVCRRCGATVEVEGPEVERWAAKVATRAGYTDVEHVVEVLGTCAGCARRRR